MIIVFPCIMSDFPASESRPCPITILLGTLYYYEYECCEKGYIDANIFLQAHYCIEIKGAVYTVWIFI